TRVRTLVAGQPEARGRSGLLRAGALLLCTAAPVMLPDVRPPSGAPEPAALLAGALPAPIATLLRDVAALRDEVAALHESVARSPLAHDAGVLALLAQIDARLQLLVERCVHVIDQFLSPSVPVR